MGWFQIMGGTFCIAFCIARSLHTSAYDRIEAEKGSEIESAAFDLVAMSDEEAVKTLRETPMSVRSNKKRVARPGVKPKRVKRDS